ncbi:MAG: MATE family efflux transporter [Bacteroidetes Order II. Incertae sedis bacterium]|nr:MATE family efflux transporter [Bacteroidetes Order II. bacterium]
MEPNILPRRFLSYRSEIRNHLKLALPMAGAQLAQVALTFIDNVMCGRIGPDAIAGVGLGVAVYSTLWCFGLGLALAVGPMVSQAYGANDEQAIGRALRMSVWTVFLFGLPSMAILYHIAPFLQLTGQSPVVVSYANQYLQALIWGFIPSLWLIAVRGLLDSVNLPQIGLLVNLSGILVNVFANWTLMFGADWGVVSLPALGVAGTGYATTLVNVWMLTALILYLRLNPRFKKLHLFQKLLHPDVPYLKEVLRIGTPIGLAFLVEVGLFAMTAILMGTISKTALAAHQIALNVASVTFMFAVGISMASTTRVGQAIGEGNPEAARRAGIIGMVMGGISMMSMGIFFLAMPKWIIQLYIDVNDPKNAEVVQLAIMLLALAAIFQLFDAIQVTSAGALRGLKDTRTPAIIGFWAYWGIGVTSGVLLAFYFGFQEKGLWIGLILGLAAASVLLSTTFLRRFSKPNDLLTYHTLE